MTLNKRHRDIQLINERKVTYEVSETEKLFRVIVDSRKWTPLFLTDQSTRRRNEAIDGRGTQGLRLDAKFNLITHHNIARASCIFSRHLPCVLCVAIHSRASICSAEVNVNLRVE